MCFHFHTPFRLPFFFTDALSLITHIDILGLHAFDILFSSFLIFSIPLFDFFLLFLFRTQKMMMRVAYAITPLDRPLDDFFLFFFLRQMRQRCVACR